MKILDRIISTEVFFVFLFSVAVFVGFVWVAFGPLAAALKYRGMGIPLRLILEIAVFNIVPIFGYALPISMLLAVLTTCVRMSENSEAVALFAGGISLYRLLFPMAVVALIVTIAGMVITNSIVPYTVERVADFKTNISKEIKPTNEAFGLPALRDSDGHLLATIWVDGGFDEHANALRHVTINEYDPKTGKPLVTVYADKAQWQGGSNWSLKDAVVLGIGSRNEAVTLANQELKVSPRDLEALEVDPDTLNFFQLARLIARLRNGRVADVQQYETSMWEKVALPLATFIFAMVAAPIGLRPHRGYNRTIAALGGFIIIGAYYILMQILEIVAADRMIDPFVAAFFPDFLGMAVAVYLIWRAPT
jgi:lipopolysaccharide export system permease protein